MDGKQAGVEIVRDAADDEVVTRGQQFPGQHIAAFHLHVDLDAGIGVRRPLDGGNHKADGRCCDGADIDRAAAAGFHLVKLAARLAQFQQDGERPPCQRLAEFRQHHAARGPLTERAFDDGFHFGKHARGRRLCYVHGGCRGADLPVLLDHDQHAQMAHLQSGAQKRVVFKDEKRVCCLRLLIHFLVAHSPFYTPHRLLYRFNIA